LGAVSHLETLCGKVERNLKTERRKQTQIFYYWLPQFWHTHQKSCNSECRIRWLQN